MGSSRADEPEVLDYASLLRRRWAVIVTSTVLGIAVSAALVALLPDVYESKAVVLVSANRDGGSDSDISLDTEAGRFQGAAIATRAQTILHSQETPAALAADVKITIPRDSTLLEIGYSAGSPDAAAAGANAFAKAYLDSRRVSELERYRRQIKTLESEVGSLSAKLAEASSDNGDQRQVLSEQLQAFGSKLADTKIAIADVRAGELITAAALPTSPASPEPKVFLPAGLLAGLLIGLVLAVVVDKSDKYLRSAADVERVLDLPVLLSLRRDAKTSTLGFESARSRTGQRFHELGHALVARLRAGGDAEPRVIVVAGASPGQVSDLVALNMAAALARTRQDVVLVEADPRSKAIGALLGTVDRRGLAEVLQGALGVAEAETMVQSTPSLRIIPRGQDADVVGDLLQGDQMAAVVQALRRRARHIVIDAPSTASGADTQALARLADLVVLVVEEGRTRYEHVRDGLRQIEHVGGAVPGVVVVPAAR